MWCGVVCRAPARRVWFVTERRAGERDQPAADAAISVPARNEIVDDIGTVLAKGQIIRHDFVISNSEGQPLQIRRVTASPLCCSAVELQPKSIPCKARARCEVVLKPGFSSGYKSVFFDVETDSRQKPRLMLGFERGSFRSGKSLQSVNSSAPFRSGGRRSRLGVPLPAGRRRRGALIRQKAGRGRSGSQGDF